MRKRLLSVLLCAVMIAGMAIPVSADELIDANVSEEALIEEAVIDENVSEEQLIADELIDTNESEEMVIEEEIADTGAVEESLIEDNEIEAYKVTYNTNGHGTAPAPAFAKNATISKPEDPIAEGYAFWGWYKEATCTNAWDFATDIVNSNITLYAKWHEQKEWQGSGSQLNTDSCGNWVVTTLSFDHGIDEDKIELGDKFGQGRFQHVANNKSCFFNGTEINDRKFFDVENGEKAVLAKSIMIKYIYA